MEDQPITPTESVTNVLRAQFDLMLAYLDRPVVQRQLLIIGVILVIVWVLPTILRWLYRRLNEGTKDGSGRSRRLVQRAVSFQSLIAPIAGILFCQLAIWILSRLDQPNGLINNSLRLFWIWLIYRVVVLVLHASSGPDSRRYQKWIITPVFLIVIIGMLVDSLFGLRVMFEIELVNVSLFHITLGALITASIILYVFIIASWLINDFLKSRLPGWINADPGVVNSITTLTRYTIIGLGILAALAALGVNLSSLALVAGGLSVGIGLGLQDIIVNFVSGLVLLFEQSLRPGDVVDVNGEIGVVENLSIRATTIRTRDNVEVIVPNGAFTTSQVTTYTRTERQVRLLIPIGVGYDSTPEEVRRVAETSAARHNLILKNPAPDLLFRGFGESSLNFDLAVWIDQPELRRQIESDLYYMLFKAFSENHITIPFPQRDLNLGKGWEVLKPSLEGSFPTGVQADERT